MDNLKSLEHDAESLVKLAKKAGADDCDVVVARGNSVSVSVRHGVVENTNRSEGDAYSLRVFCGKKVASVNSNTNTDFETLANRAVSMANASPEDAFQGLADKEKLYDTKNLQKDIAALELLDEFEPSVELLQSNAKEAEAAGLAVEGVTNSMGASAGWGQSGFVLATSDGFVGSVERSGFSVSASMVAGEGVNMQRDYEFDSAVHYKRLIDPATIGQSAGERTVKRLSPKQVKSGNYPIIFDPRVSNSVLGALMSAINGASIARKTSFLRDKLDQKVAHQSITVMDDPMMVHKAGSRPFDGEGVEAKAIEFLKDGMLQEWILDSATSRELSLQTNGRASRGGSSTSPSTTNCYIQPGQETPQDLISGIDDGLYLTETIGHGINMITGDFSKGAAGFWIENGELTFPVAEITIAGNLADMFNQMIPANDLEFKYSTNSPTLLIEGMTIGGT